MHLISHVELLRLEADVAIVKTLNFIYALSHKSMAGKNLNEIDGAFEVENL
jgi:hypothetical protein